MSKIVLDGSRNYIVSGLERSGTSMMMQILHSGGVPVAFDDSRLPDENNPKGYYELEGGKIIGRLADGSFSLDKYRGSFLKITAYGLKYLPPGNYSIIYCTRDIEEVLDSMSKMAGAVDDDRDVTRKAFVKMDKARKELLKGRPDTAVLFMNYNEILGSPVENLKSICDFLDTSENVLPEMLSVVDASLYRQRRR